MSCCPIAGRLQCLDQRIDSIETVRNEVTAWQARRDSFQAKVNWQFAIKCVRVTLKRLYPTSTLSCGTNLTRGEPPLQLI